MDQKTREAFGRDGAVLLPGLFSEWVATLRRGIDRNREAPGPFVKEYPAYEGGPLFFGDYCNWDRIPEYRSFLFESPVAAIAAELMGASRVRLFHEHVLVKDPGATLPTPWHHDQPYYCVDGQQTCSIWLVLDEVPQDTCLEFVAGSHSWGRWFRPDRFNGAALNEGDELAPVPDIESDRGAYDILSWSLKPGDAIAFTFLTLHGAPPNRSESRARRAFSSRWVGDDARFAKRGGVTSPPFPEVELEHGAPLDHPSFPIVFEKPS